VNEAKLAQGKPQQTVVGLVRVEDPEAELDQMWSFVQSQQQQRWLWPGIDHQRGEVLAYVLVPHYDEAFELLKALLALFGYPLFSAMVGERMNAILMPLSIPLAKPILRRLSENI
jgi:hypothetical protein